MIDRNSATPVYIQIKDHFINMIELGQLPVNSQFPTENEIVAQSGVSRMTVRHGIRLLIEQGYIRIVRGVGTFVASNRLALDTMNFSSLSQRYLQQGHIIENDVFIFKKIKVPSDIAILLELDLDDFVWYIERLRSLKGQPLMLEHMWLPTSIFPTLTKENLLKSRYEWIQKYCNRKITYANRFILPIQAGRKKGKIFNLPIHTPILSLNSTAFFDNNVPFEFVKMFYHPKDYILSGKVSYNKSL